MRTYTFCGLFLAVFALVSCSSSENGSDTPGDGPTVGAAVDYTLLMDSGNMITSKSLNANGEVITMNPTAAPFGTTDQPDFTYRDGNVISFYNTTGPCGGAFTKYDFSTDTAQDATIFEDLGDCGLTALGIAHSDDTVYIGYGVVENDTETNYFIRAIPTRDQGGAPVDIPMVQKPEHLVFANNRLFVLTSDLVTVNENKLYVMDAATNSFIIEMNLGTDARRLIKDADNDVIVSYDTLHTIMNSQTLSQETVRYREDLPTEFAASDFHTFDSSGSLYYIMPPGDNATYSFLPAIYNFSSNLIVLYDFEQFLSDQKRNLEYEIETATAVTYDEGNNFLVIGYKKIGMQKGGILRVFIGEQPAVIDNLDVDGIPYAILEK